MPARPRAPLGMSQHPRAGRAGQVGCRVTVKGRGSRGPRVWTPAPSPPAVWPWPRASPGLSSEKEHPCWEAMPSGALSAHVAWSTQRSCSQEHSAFVWPGALSAHAAWSTQHSCGLEHSALTWPGALCAHGRVGSSSALAGLRASGPQPPHGLRREWRQGLLSHQSVCTPQRWTDRGHLNHRVRTKGQQ